MVRHCDEAVVIQAPQWFRRKRGLKIYERFALDRSLAPLLSGYRVFATGYVCGFLRHICKVGSCASRSTRKSINTRNLGCR